MDFDLGGLGSRTTKMEREREKRRLEAKKKLEKDRKAKAEAKIKEEEMRERQRIAKLKMMEEEEKREEARLAEERKTAGINYSAVLKSVPSVTEGDRVVLPPSALEALNPQNALDIGPLTFELKSENGCTTHAGVSGEP
jgi:hypothetical protein